jgi:hypothetical protein
MARRGADDRILRSARSLNRPKASPVAYEGSLLHASNTNDRPSELSAERLALSCVAPKERSD